MFVAGIDAHATYSVICVVSNGGELVHGPVRIKNAEADQLTELLEPFRPLEVVVETSPAWPWLFDRLHGNDADFFFATPHHSWERGTNENTNGLIRQYAPKRTSLARLTQNDCDSIAERLNNRPRKRLAYRTPAECYELNSAALLLLHFKLDVTRPSYSSFDQWASASASIRPRRV